MFCSPTRARMSRSLNFGMVFIYIISFLYANSTLLQYITTKGELGTSSPSTSLAYKQPGSWLQFPIRGPGGFGCQRYVGQSATLLHCLHPLYISKLAVMQALCYYEHRKGGENT